MKRSRIRLSPIPPATTAPSFAFTYQLGGGDAQPGAGTHVNPGKDAIQKARSPLSTNVNKAEAEDEEKEKEEEEEKNNNNENEKEAEDLNLSYDDVLSKTDVRHDTTMQAWEDRKQEAEGSLGRYSSSHADQDDEPSINPIKEFNLKAKGLSDQDLSLLDSSMVSQRNQDPLSATNSSIISTYLFKPSTQPQGLGKQSTLPSTPMPTSNSTPNIARVAVNPYTDTTPLARPPCATRPVMASSHGFVIDISKKNVGRHDHGPFQPSCRPP
jgi:hypothetical protein